MSDITGEREDTLEKLAERFIRGNGIETGTAPRGFPVPPGVCIRQVHESALSEDAGNHGTNDTSLTALDFCISGDIVLDAGDPETILHQHLLMLRPGGILFVLIPCGAAPADHPPALIRSLFSRVPRSSENTPDAAIRKILKKEKILTLPVRIRWQGYQDTERSRRYIFIIERFDYITQIQELLQKKAASPESRSCPADVVIPVFNAYDDLLRCLYSVMVHHENEQIILIDDASTDPRIGSLFSSLEPYQSSWFVLIRQEKNRGFAATVNRGMHYSQNDVILLNSDTIVTKGWVKKLQGGAGSLKNCGTMTPLSNNGTLTSVPVMMENNLLPPGISIDSYADMIEKISFGQFPRIPAGIGFCLYISRECLDAIGYFDEVTYREGYGEETDFCLRAKEAGMTHHVCDTTFIYHRGMASFSDGAMRHLKKGIAALDARYPSYQDEVMDFILKNPLRGIQENITCRGVTWDFSGSISRGLYIPGRDSRAGYDRQAGESGEGRMYYILRGVPPEYCLSEYNRGNHLDYTFPADVQSPGAVLNLIEKILCSFRISYICLDHPDTRISNSAAKFHIPCRISSCSSGPATREENGTDQAHCMKSGDTSGSGFSDGQGPMAPLHERQEPDWSSGRQFTSVELFRSIRVFPDARFRGIIPFGQDTPGSLPVRFFRCLEENGILYTLQRIRFFLMHRKEGRA
jgi:GT2 family glycosyltransferase